MAHLPPDIQEQILVRLSGRDLIRCKSVCKSWLSLISSEPWFIKAHLKQSYISNHYNNEIGDRRIIISTFPGYFLHHPYNDFHVFFEINDSNLLGSSDGLVCISDSSHVLVVNPLTREVNKITQPKIPETESLRWGFGYNSSMDDYNVVLGFKKDKILTCFQVLSLGSNVWKVIGEVDYVFLSSIGVLFNGALHWVAYTTLKKTNVILSFHLEDEKFLEVSLPDKLAYQLYLGKPPTMSLGIVENCLCVFQDDIFFDGIWVMKVNNKEKYWENVAREYENKYHTMHCLKLFAVYLLNKYRNGNCLKLFADYLPNKRPLCHETLFCQSRLLVGALLYVESLVSPHFRNKESRARSTMKSSKVKPNDCVEALLDVSVSKDDGYFWYELFETLLRDSSF